MNQRTESKSSQEGEASKTMEEDNANSDMLTELYKRFEPSPSDSPWVDIYTDRLSLKVRKCNVLHSKAGIYFLRKGLMFDFTVFLMVALLILKVWSPFGAWVGADSVSTSGDEVTLIRWRNHPIVDLCTCMLGILLLWPFLHQSNVDIFRLTLTKGDTFIVMGSCFIAELIEFAEREVVFGRADVTWTACSILTVFLERLPVILCLATMDSPRLRDAFEGDKLLNRLASKLRLGFFRSCFERMAKSYLRRVIFLIMIILYLLLSKLELRQGFGASWSDDTICITQKYCLTRMYLFRMAQQNVIVFTGKYDRFHKQLVNKNM